jgi:hypothetical protein
MAKIDGQSLLARMSVTLIPEGCRMSLINDEEFWIARLVGKGVHPIAYKASSHLVWILRPELGCVPQLQWRKSPHCGGGDRRRVTVELYQEFSVSGKSPDR